MSFAFGVLEAEVVGVGAVDGQPELPADHRHTLVVEVAAAGVARVALGDDPEDLFVLDQLLGGGHVAGGVTAVVDVHEGDLPVAELAFGVGLGDPGFDAVDRSAVEGGEGPRRRDDRPDLDLGVLDAGVVLAWARLFDRLQILELVARARGAGRAGEPQPDRGHRDGARRRQDPTDPTSTHVSPPWSSENVMFEPGESLSRTQRGCPVTQRDSFVCA